LGTLAVVFSLYLWFEAQDKARLREVEASKGRINPDEVEFDLRMGIRSSGLLTGRIRNRSSSHKLVGAALVLTIEDWAVPRTNTRGRLSQLILRRIAVAHRLTLHGGPAIIAVPRATGSNLKYLLHTATCANAEWTQAEFKNRIFSQKYEVRLPYASSAAYETPRNALCAQSSSGQKNVITRRGQGFNCREDTESLIMD
jgi:hypothetical protein